MNGTRTKGSNLKNLPLITISGHNILIVCIMQTEVRVYGRGRKKFDTRISYG